MTEVVESRFAHLLEPIRDLASNWHIDIASELEEYLSELEHIRIQFDPSQLSQSQSQPFGALQSGPGRSLNFAQAALLIQGSACIYSRKVEYLYTLLYQTLDVLIDQRKAKQLASSVDVVSGDDLDAALSQSEQEAALLSLDDTMADGANIDLPEAENARGADGSLLDETTAPPAARQQTLLIRAPLSLLSDNLLLSGGADSKNGADDAQRAQHALSNSFKLSQCVMHSSGALLLEEKETMLLQANDKLEVDPIVMRRMGLTATPGNMPASLPFGSPRGILLENLHASESAAAAADGTGLPASNLAQQLEDALDGLGGDGGGGFDDDDHENELEHKWDHEHEPVSAGRKKSVRFADEAEEAELNDVSDAPTALEDDFWAQLDPHDNSALVPRPYRRGVTTRKPHVPASGALTPDLTLHLLHAAQAANPAQAILLRAIAKNNVQAPFFAEFSSLYLREQEQRKRRRKAPKPAKSSAVRSTKHVAPPSSSDVVPLQDQDDDDSGFGGGGGFDLDDALGEPMRFLSDDGQEVDQWQAAGADGSSAAAVAEAALDGGTLDAKLSRLAQSYEDLCKEHVDAYLRSAEQFLTSSHLSRRVLDWQERLLPLLEAEEAHKPFDIHQYGRSMLDTVQQHTSDKQEEKVVDFSVAAQGQPRYEVCRLFLAALQLANNGNLSIARSNLASAAAESAAGGDSTVASASMSLTLLSMEDHSLAAQHDDDDAAHNAPVASTGVSKGKRKHAAADVAPAGGAGVPSGVENAMSSAPVEPLADDESSGEASAPRKQPRASASSAAPRPLAVRDPNRRTRATAQ